MYTLPLASDLMVYESEGKVLSYPDRATVEILDEEALRGVVTVCLDEVDGSYLGVRLGLRF